jgi:TolB-like protein/tetratricopeptide (TPR) repeat protein
MLTGRRPFESDYEQALVYSILNEDPKPLAEFRSDVPEALEKICRRALAKGPSDRYQSASELIADLQSYTTGSELAGPTRRMPVRKRRWVAAGAAAVIVVAVIIALMYSPGHAEAIDAIAVLPFVNVSNSSDTEYICDGLTAAVLDDLCRVPGIRRVIALSSVMPYKNKEIIPNEVSRKLSVAALVMCRLSQHGDEVSISVELVNGKDEQRLWGAQYSRPLSQLSVIHKEISESVAEALHLTGRRESPSPVPQQSTQNADAYRLYLQGQQLYHTVSEDGLHTSIDYYRRALQLDPRFAAAYAGIAQAFCQLTDQNYVPWAQVADSIRLNATQALSLDRNLAEAHLAIADVRYKNYERRACEEEEKKAIELNPLYADAIHKYAHSLSESGRHEEAIAFMRKSTELEPLSVHYQYCLAGTYRWARRYDEALREYEKVKELDSTFYPAYAQMAHVYFARGEFDRAIQMMETCVRREKDPARLMLLRAKVSAATGRVREARVQLRRLYRWRDGRGADPADIASVLALIGDKDSAMAWLETAYQERSNQFDMVNVKPEFDSLRSDPRFRQFLARSGFTL